jgi:peptidoglycan/LPS O-acetylase OafA/YrhL
MSTLLVPAAVTVPDKAGSRIPTLDGWRGVAILLVLVDHASRNSRFQDKAWASLGFFGVDIFFVISGYIITARLLEERKRTSTIKLSEFYKRRAFRILPLVCAYLLTLCLLHWIVGLGDFHASEVFGSLFFFRNYQIAAHPGGIFTAHFWSLSIEEHFYLVWPALLLFIGNKRALWFALSGAVACSIWRLYDQAHPHSFGQLLPGVSVIRLLRTDVHFDGLLLGCALAIVLPKVHSFIFRNFPKETPLFAALAIFFNLQWTDGRPTLTTSALIAIMIASTLIVEEGLMHKWLNSQWLVWVGVISYSLYVWQQLFLLHPNGSLPLHRLSMFPLNIICVFLAASCSFYFLEQPMIAVGRRQRERRSAPVAA